MKQYVIIGNGVAAASCIEGIRSVDPDGAITVISEEKHPVYCRPLISYYLQGKTDLLRMRYRDEDFYAGIHVTLSLFVSDSGLDRDDSSVSFILDGAEKLLHVFLPLSLIF